VTYTVYTNATCTSGAEAAGKVTVTNGTVQSSDTITFTNAGLYFWQAVYSGDTSDNGATSPCIIEPLLVIPNVFAAWHMVFDEIKTLFHVTRGHEARLLAQAGLRLKDSLDRANWIDDNHLRPGRGSSVFQDDRVAVTDLLAAQPKTLESLSQVHGSRSEPGTQSSVQALVDQVVSSDAILAHDEIQAASAAHGGSKKLEAAGHQLGLGNSLSNRAGAASAIEAYLRAWEDAEQSLAPTRTFSR
jgi:hypothetical protein